MAKNHSDWKVMPLTVWDVYTIVTWELGNTWKKARLTLHSHSYMRIRKYFKESSLDISITLKTENICNKQYDMIIFLQHLKINPMCRESDNPIRNHEDDCHKWVNLSSKEDGSVQLSLIYFIGSPKNMLFFENIYATDLLYIFFRASCCTCSLTEQSFVYSLWRVSNVMSAKVMKLTQQKSLYLRHQR